MGGDPVVVAWFVGESTFSFSKSLSSVSGGSNPAWDGIHMVEYELKFITLC